MRGFILVLCMLLAGQVTAQKITAKEKKEYRKKAKALKKEFKEQYKDPEKFAEFKENSTASKRKADSLNRELMEVKNQERIAANKLEKTKEEKEISQERLVEARNMLEQAKMTGIPPKGTFFAVQVTNLTQEELMQILSKDNAGLLVVTDVFGNDIFLLGLFEEASQAQELKVHVQLMGFKSARVVTYQDGKLISYEEMTSGNIK